jgi:hypothetical protein
MTHAQYAYKPYAHPDGPYFKGVLSALYIINGCFMALGKGETRRQRLSKNTVKAVSVCETPAFMKPMIAVVEAEISQEACCAQSQSLPRTMQL